MAINADTSYEANHTLLIASTGGRKSTFIKAKRGLIKTVSALAGCKRWVIWDPDEDHTGTRCRSVSVFCRQLEKAASCGKPFRLCLTVDVTPDNFEAFCQAVWVILDGRKLTGIVAEELADVTTPSKAGIYWGQLLRKSRKYGGIIVAASQRPQEIDKTCFSQCVHKWIGYIAVGHDVRRMARETGVSEKALFELKPGGYLFVRAGNRDPENGVVNYR